MEKIVLQQRAMLLLLPLTWLLVVIFAWSRRFKPFGAFLLRLAIVVLAVLALSQPVIPPPPSAAAVAQENLVLLVDRSASITPAQQQIFAAEIARLRQQFPQATVIDFADRPVILSGEATITSTLQTDVSNLADALALGAELFNNQPGRIILFSDGQPTTGDTSQVINALIRRNIPVDVLAPSAASLPDTRLVSLDAPTVLRQGETSSSLEVVAHSSGSAEAVLRVMQDNTTLLREETVALQPGLNHFSLPLKADTLGLHTFKATVTAAADSQPANNSMSALSQVYPAPKLLVVADDPTEAATFSAWLKQAGFGVDQLPAVNLPDRLSALEPYAGMVLVNVSARSLRLEQMLAIQEFTRSLGRGLLVTGGRNSFSLGKYEDTPLAELLPVSLDPPARKERPPVALLLIIDHSGSMVEERGAVGTRLVLAKEAAIRALNILTPQDMIGILIFDSDYEWMVPFQQVGDGATLLKIQQDISRIPGGSATRVLQALEVGVTEFLRQQTNIKARHIVLFSDGKSYDEGRGVPDYDAIVDQARAADITLSTISIGATTDEELMAHLADRGKGRYHRASTPEELPELTIAESDILRSEAVQEGNYDPAMAAAHPMTRGFLTPAAPECQSGTCPPERKIPPLSGYIAMTPQSRAEMALQTGPGDPLLSVWGYGLGRVAAWSADTGREWASTWPAWPGVSPFWAQVVDYTLPAPNLGLLQLKSDSAANGLVTLTASGVKPDGQTFDLARAKATLITPAGREIALSLRQTAPGRYQQQLQLSDPGAYRVNLALSRDDLEETTRSGFVLPYPAEYALPDKEAGLGEPLLQQLASSTGGQVLTTTALLAPGGVAPTELKTEPVILWPWLLLGALLLWPVEIAWRRWARLRI